MNHVFVTDIAKTKCMLNGVSVSQNQEDISYMFEESTPIKACGDLAYQFDNSGETSFLQMNEFFPSSGQHCVCYYSY